MTLEWRPLEPGAVDHERLWTSVLAASAAMMLAMLAAIGPPPIGCVFKALTGLPCLTCGSTRSVVALMSGDVLAAARWNPLVPLGTLAGAAYGAYGVVVLAAGTRRLRARLTRAEAPVMRWGAVLFMVVVWGWLIADGR